ncbi:hypothetical protein YA35_13710 [Klebsiella aerogenes]|nr:hypothetical protein YA35_13710 [Klebsiella aerogenes]
MKASNEQGGILCVDYRQQWKRFIVQNVDVPLNPSRYGIARSLTQAEPARQPQHHQGLADGAA